MFFFSLTPPGLLKPPPSVRIQLKTKDLLADSVITPGSSEVPSPRRQGSQVTVEIPPGKDGYPGVPIKPMGGKWDLRRFGHVEANVTNTGKAPMNISLRVDNPGNWQDNPWNAETVRLQPGQTGTVTTIFGYSYGFKKGFPLDPANVGNLVVFTEKSPESQSFRIEAVTAAGPPHEKPPVLPADLRTEPKKGVLYPSPDATLLKVGSGGESGVRVQPKVGRWDLTRYTQVTLRLKNLGQTASTPKARLDSNGGSGDWIRSPKPVPAGGEAEIALPFQKAVDLSDPSGLMGQITSDAIGAVSLLFGKGPFQVLSITAELNPAAVPPWLGTEPPVPGQWVRTLDEEFDGNSLNRALWRAEGPNYYDKLSHWSKNNVILGKGFARLRYEKKKGFHNDDPKEAATPHASGYLDTYGLWTQRYGYFETRVKVPTAPGLWPAFWMMPDRGVAGGPEQWKRQDTANGGMEFDIMEHLSRWGPHRFNIAMHYDGYAKDHKQLGSDKVYAAPDNDGFVSCGLLWLPGLAAYYYNGKEVLRWKNPRVSSVPSILMFTLPTGGWDNNDLDDSQLPADLIVDYVRVWQLKEFVGK